MTVAKMSTEYVDTNERVSEAVADPGSYWGLKSHFYIEIDIGDITSQFQVFPFFKRAQACS